MLAGPERRHSKVKMHMVRGGNEDGFHIGLFQKLPGILKNRKARGLCLFQPGRLNVAGGGVFRFRYAY